MHSIYDYFFTHDKLMATYKNLTPSLRFLPLFNCIQCHLPCVFLIHKGFVDTPKKIQLKFSYMLKHSKGGNVFQNPWKRGYHISMSMVIVRQLSMYQKIAIDYSHTCEHYITYITIFSTHDKWMAVYPKLTYSLCFPPFFNYNQYCYLPSV
jgi:hypothetical protein